MPDNIAKPKPGVYEFWESMQQLVSSAYEIKAAAIGTEWHVHENLQQSSY